MGNRPVDVGPEPLPAPCLILQRRGNDRPRHVATWPSLHRHRLEPGIYRHVGGASSRRRSSPPAGRPAVRYLSVCSGIEAVSVAWRPLGWEAAMFAEIDPFCAWLLRSRYGAFASAAHAQPERCADTQGSQAARRGTAQRRCAAAARHCAELRRLHKDRSRGCWCNRPSGRRYTLPVFLRRR